MKQTLLLDLISTPVWLINAETEVMLQANKAGLELLDGGTLADLRQGQLSALCCPRLQDYVPNLRLGEKVREIWTVTRQGRALSLSCQLKLLTLDDGQLAILAEGLNHQGLEQRPEPELHHAAAVPEIAPSTDDACKFERLLYENMFRANTAPMLLIDPQQDGRIIDANQAALSFYGYTHTQMCALHTWEINLLGRKVMSIMHEVHSWEGGHKPLSFQHRRADGSVREVQTYAGPVDIAGRRLMLSVIHDITAQKDIEKFNELLLDSNHTGIFAINLAGEILFSNPASTNLLGYSHIHEVIGKSIDGFSVSDAQIQVAELNLTDPCLTELCLRVMTSGEPISHQECWIRSASGKTFPCMTFLAPIKTRNAITGVVVSYSDITERKQMEAELLQAAQHDPLTGTWNRRQFDRFLRDSLALADRYGHPFALVMIDVDNFKRINDRYGHDVGDQVLKRLAEVLTARIREVDYLCRWGGEEFILLLPNTALENAARLAEDLRMAVLELYMPPLEGISISLGVAQYQPGEQLEPLIKRTDQALYRAKAKGRNRIEVAQAVVPPTS